MGMVTIRRPCAPLTSYLMIYEHITSEPSHSGTLSALPRAIYIHMTKNEPSHGRQKQCGASEEPAVQKSKELGQPLQMSALQVNTFCAALCFSYGSPLPGNIPFCSRLTVA
jgi:hypothetical protein